jgi:hypothetical protein
MTYGMYVDMGCEDAADTVRVLSVRSTHTASGKSHFATRTEILSARSTVPSLYSTKILQNQIPRVRHFCLLQ